MTCMPCLVDDQTRQGSTFLVEGLQPLQHFGVGHPSGAVLDDGLGGVEQVALDDRFERAVGSDPHVWTIPNPRLLELEGHAVPHVVAHVLGIGQDLVDSPPAPGSAVLGRDFSTLQERSNFGLQPAFIDEGPIHPVHGLDFDGFAGDQDHPIGLDALVLPASQRAFVDTFVVHEHTAKSETRGASLAVADFDQAALAGEYLGRQFAAVPAGHRPLDALDDGRNRAAVVLELLSTVLDRNAGPLADVFVVGAFVGVLEAAPAADVVYEDRRELGSCVLYIRDQSLERVAAVEPQAALAFVGVGAHDFEAASLGVSLNLVGLVLGRIALMLGRHPDILGGSPCTV